MDRTTGDRQEVRGSEQYVAGTTFRRQWKRSMALAHAKTQADLRESLDYSGKPRFNRAGDFLKVQALLWIWHYVKSRFGRKWKFAEYQTQAGDHGVYELSESAATGVAGEPVRVVLAGDWGSGTQEAFDVSRAIEGLAPHFTIHLGDIYFVGTKSEVQENMLGGRVNWPLGSRGSFALNANHEMYARGKAYFKYLLPTLGMRDPDSGANRGQGASYFCLKNDHWLVIGLDTGYHSVGLPIWEKIVKPSAKLPKGLVQWLRSVVQLQDDGGRGIILLSHHQYYSQFEGGYKRAAKQLRPLLSRPALWFWGHEHRFAIYGQHEDPKARLSAYGRCVGHGGLPIEDIEDDPKSDKKHDVGLVLYDRRKRVRIGPSGTWVGYNGFANLTFEGRRLTVEHWDTNEPIVRERWEVGDGGALKGIAIEQLKNDDDLVVYAESLEQGIV